MGCETGHQYIEVGNICGGCGWRKPPYIMRADGSISGGQKEVQEVKDLIAGVDKEPLADLETLAREYFRSYRVGWNQPSLEGLVRLLERVRAGA